MKFNYKDYSFRILTEGKEFKFTEVSDGYAAILDMMEPTPANRALVAAELSIEQEMLGFKYWVIRDNHLEAEFKDEIVWNKH